MKKLYCFSINIFSLRPSRCIFEMSDSGPKAAEKAKPTPNEKPKATAESEPAKQARLEKLMQNSIKDVEYLQLHLTQEGNKLNALRLKSPQNHEEIKLQEEIVNSAEENMKISIQSLIQNLVANRGLALPASFKQGQPITSARISTIEDTTKTNKGLYIRYGNDKDQIQICIRPDFSYESRFDYEDKSVAFRDSRRDKGAGQLYGPMYLPRTDGAAGLEQNLAEQGRLKNERGTHDYPGLETITLRNRQQ